VPILYPYNTLPSLKCYVLPSLAVINAGKKFKINKVDVITSVYHREESNETQVAAIMKHLTLLSEIYDLIEGIRDDAKEWREVKRGKKKQDSGDDDIKPNSPKSSHIITCSALKFKGKFEPTC
jgi:hypothetical protein